MKAEKCLYCYNDLIDYNDDFHKSCAKKFFKSESIPTIPYTENSIYELGKKLIDSSISVTGVQPKVSLDFEKKKKNSNGKLTIVGFEGIYILKPPVPKYPYLPEYEDLTMKLAKLARLKTVEHSLIRMGNGKLAYITKRLDRMNDKKIHMEDFCQLSGRLTEDKYKSSYESVGRLISKYSERSGLDLINFAEIVLFSFITGNSDMHLKNFSLIRLKNIGNVLSPFYDLIPSNILLPEDPEETALTLNGKKKNIRIGDFDEFFTNLKISDKVKANIFEKYKQLYNSFSYIIERSFLGENEKYNYNQLIKKRLERLKLF